MEEETFAFGSFRLIPARRVLLEDGTPLRLGSRALDILVTLVESAGETIGKDQLIARAWPDTVVEENALRVHVAALRKALGDGRGGNRYIVNIPGRGYSFIAPVTREQRQPAIAPTNGTAVRGNLPAPLTRIVGRDDIIAALAAQLAQRRLLTIVGPGGIGKTTVAVAVAEALSSSYADGVWFVGLASLPDPDLVASALGTVLGLSLPGANPLSGLAGWLRDKHALIVLDSCEHVIGAVAAIAEAILKAAARVSILATSREPLRAGGEWVHRLSSLELPPRSENLTLDGALQYSAVQLFNERALAITDGFALGDEDVAPVLEICHRLDGVPLALELAAARVDVFGVKGLAARLDDRFTVLTGGRRTALPRHQTLRAAMDWSYELLPETEQIILRRLAVFHGDFTIDAGAAVATDDRIGTADVFEAIANLAAKSLISTDISSDFTYHRLLDTTRAYALEKLSESGEIERVRARHAAHYRDLFEGAETESEVRPATAWLADYGRQIDNLRAALDWAFSPSGDASIGIALTAAAVPLWTQLSLLEECRGRVERALAALKSMAAPNPRPEMLLQAALANAVLGTAGTVDAVGSAWNRALELAEELDDIDQQLRALYGLYTYQVRIGEYRKGLAFARKFCAAAEKKSDPSDLLLGDRIVGVSLFCLGDPGGARAKIERMLARSPALRPRLQAVRFGLDQRMAALVHLSRILWVQGYPDQAVRTAAAGVDEAAAIGHTFSLGFALADGACPVSAWVGDRAATARFVGMLSARAEKLGLAIWHAYGLAWRGWLADREGDSATAIALLDAAIGEFRATQFDLHFTTFLGAFAEILTRAGRVADGVATISDAVTRAELTEERWCFPELLRIQGDITRRLSGPDATQLATDLYMRALDWARRQSALSWELRAATSLAQLWRDQHRATEARALLGSVYGRFTEGFATADLQEARSLLEHLA
jgi:predicted ATPase/DNA-binding winged helix-turn-helix (wHTH) protein